MVVCIKILIKGTVQGVGYRYSAYLEANKRGIKGFVRNENDGSVYMEAEAEHNILKDFIIWCKEGPKNADVFEIFTTNVPLQFFKEFKIE